ncbi:MAG: type II secretion system protein [Candidatus Pacebacteria bacterium]|nr:type II secretion system protein [Candidatus Paceibacterota bacterium]MDR3582938.1 type II secretion system protein [Candidatus Paceibacterota bacterium]
MQNKNKKGFTLIEILTIVAIISILVSMILVSIYGAKVKAGDNAAFTSIQSSASAAYMCLLAESSGVSLTVPHDASSPDVCSVGGSSSWPPLTKDSWHYDVSGSDGFFWCSINGSNPPNTCSSPGSGGCGYVATSGTFCYILQNGTKKMWCTVDGCRKTGF